MDSRLEHVDFDSLLQCLSVGRLLQVFASILLERRVIFIADKLRCRLFLKTQLASVAKKTDYEVGGALLNDAVSSHFSAVWPQSV